MLEIAARAALQWRPRPVWQGIAGTGKFGASVATPGVTLTPLPPCGGAILIASASTRDAFVAAMKNAYGIEPPMTPRREANASFELIWAGPDQWYARSPDMHIAADLSSKIGGLAAITDQSGARAVVRIGGPNARDVLAKGCMLDLHPHAFAPRHAALTSIAYMGVHLWQLDAAPTYEMAVFRSMAGSLWSWLTASAAEYGYEVEEGQGSRHTPRAFGP